MSHIPNSVMPHAGPDADIGEKENSPSVFGGAGRLAEKARENPKTSIAAGAAVIAGAIAAAAIPFIRARNKTDGKSASNRPRKASNGSGQSRSRKSSPAAKK
ncbi:MAG TPA: hypothetical protein VNT77_01160 [Allosphingosinicella sp.]|nr:hypothetical protein [Allosphingosinicella sp.]